MDEELKFDDDELEILDFSIDDEPPKKQIEEIEILDFDDDIKTCEQQKESVEKIKINTDLLNSIGNDNINSNISNRTLLTKEPSKEKVNNVIIPNNIQEITNDKPQIENSKILNNDFNGQNEKTTVVTHKRKLKLKSVFVGILILVILVSVIILLPKINEYVNKQTNTNYQNNNNELANEIFKSNIDIKSVLTKIKDYKNYQYQNNNDILTKDKNNNPLTIKSSYIYIFNETKFSVEINKEVADFSYNSKDYYEKLDDVHNLYVNDITTNTYTKKISTVEEFNLLQTIYPNVINYLIDNHEIVDEKQIKSNDENKILITLKVPIQILNYLSVETDRIQNKLDISITSINEVNVELLFNEDKKIEKIDFVVEDKNLYHEKLDNEVESSLLKYSFTELNKIGDISLPIE